MKWIWRWVKRIATAIFKEIYSIFKIIWQHLRGYWWLRLLMYTLVVSIALSLWAQINRLSDNPNSFVIFIFEFFRDWAEAIGAVLMLMIVGAAFLAIMDNRQNQARNVREREQKENRDRKERLLEKINDWVLEIHTASLKVQYPVTNIEPESATIQIEANILLKYSTALARSSLIRAIVNRTFKEELAEDINKLIEVFNGFMFLKNRELGLGDVREDFAGNAPDVMNRIAEQIKSKPETETELLNRYTVEKSAVCVALLNRIGNILSSL